MQCASWPEAMAEACEDTCHRCHISWMQPLSEKMRNGHQILPYTSTCYQVVNWFLLKKIIIDINNLILAHRQGDLPCASLSSLYVRWFGWHFIQTCAYDFRKKTWTVEFLGNEFCNSWIDFWFSCPWHQLLPGPTSLRQRCFQPWPCMGAASSVLDLWGKNLKEMNLMKLVSWK